MADVMNRLKSIQDQVEKGKTEKAKAEANLQTYTKQEEEIIVQIRTEGVEPEQVNDEIARLETEVKANLDKAESLLPSNSAV